MTFAKKCLNDEENNDKCGKPRRELLDLGIESIHFERNQVWLFHQNGFRCIMHIGGLIILSNHWAE